MTVAEVRYLGASFEEDLVLVTELCPNGSTRLHLVYLVCITESVALMCSRRLDRKTFDLMLLGITDSQDWRAAGLGIPSRLPLADRGPLALQALQVVLL